MAGPAAGPVNQEPEARMLLGVEYHWIHQVAAGIVEEPGDGDEDAAPYDPLAAFTCDYPSAEIIAEYRDICRRSDEILAATPLGAAPRRPDAHRGAVTFGWCAYAPLTTSGPDRGGLPGGVSLMVDRWGHLSAPNDPPSLWSAMPRPAEHGSEGGARSEPRLRARR